MRKLIYILPVIFVLAFTSCEKEIEMNIADVPEELVMYSFIYPDSALNLFTGKSTSILSPSNYQLFSEGRFRIYLNENPLGTYLLPKDTAWSNWKEFIFKAGDVVKVESFESGGRIITGSTRIPEYVPVIKIDTTSIKSKIEGKPEKRFLECKLLFKDDPVNDNFYQLHVVREGWGTLGTKPYYTRRVVSIEKEDPVFYQYDESGSILQGLNFQGLFTDYLFDGSYYALRFNIPETEYFLDYYEEKVKISIYLYHLTFDYYAFFRSKIISEGYEGLPIYESLKIHNNVNGGLGVIAGLNFHVDSLLFTK